MKKLLMTLACTSIVHGALAQEIPEPAHLPATPQALAWIDADPAVVQARRGLEAAAHSRGALAASPYEWTARFAAQRRRIRDIGADSNEWSAQLERPVRINGKAGLDRSLGDLEMEIARARLGEARREAARALSDLWLDAMAAEAQRFHAREQLAFARRNFDAVERRRRAGDASVLDVNVARSDLAEVERQASEATTQAAKARAILQVRFPGAQAPTGPGPDPTPLDRTEADWRERVLAEADALKVAEARHRRARATADRAHADRIPDPTVGVFTASEAQRNERLVGVSVTIPLPGVYRNQRVLQALREADAAEAEVERQRRDLVSTVAEAYAEAVGAVERWRVAEEGARTARASADLTQRAYTLGETELQVVLLARRQAVEASRASLGARADALRWNARLLIDAHLIWDLARD